ncbi:hypothetical protein DFH07DRAFT_739914, partial [Mycena maculata]
TPSTSQNLPSTVRTESGSYCIQLLSQGRGFPLYVPGPRMNLPAEYRRNGIAIGDVGRVTEDGIFDFFFNIYLSPENPINANVPEDFVPLASYDPIDIFQEDIDPGNYVSTPSVQHEMNPDFVFNSFESTGAVLALPHGGRLEKLGNLGTMRKYAAENAESWYKYVNGTRGRELPNGSLYLVTGWEKAKSWGMASFRDVVIPQNEFWRLCFIPITDADTDYKYRWQAGPARYKYADPPPVDGTPLNQTTFIHAFTISLCEGIWGKLFGDVEVSELTDSTLSKSGQGFVPYSSQSSSWSWSLSLFGGSSNSGVKHCTGQDPVILSDVSPIPKVCHERS